MLNLNRGIFLPLEERPVSIRPLSLYASEMLSMQKNLLEKSAAELLRTDLSHMSTKEFNTHKDYPLDLLSSCIIEVELLLHVCIHTGEVQ